MSIPQPGQRRRIAWPLAIAGLAAIGLILLLLLYRPDRQPATVAAPWATQKPFARHPAFQGARAAAASIPEYSPRVVLQEPKSVLPPVEDPAPSDTGTNGFLL